LQASNRCCITWSCGSAASSGFTAVLHCAAQALTASPVFAQSMKAAKAWR
jgi:hypothetical protein